MPKIRVVKTNGDVLEKNLTASYTDLCKKDFFKIIDLFDAQNEVPFLREAILGGRIDGDMYYGRCACLIGTLAKARKKHYENLCKDVDYYPGLHNPAEVWFYNIRKGDTPKTNFFAKKALEWCDELIELSNLIKRGIKDEPV